MFQAPLPDVPALTVCASATAVGDGWISATGLGETPQDARQRHDAERAERMVAAQSGIDTTARLMGMAAGQDDLQDIENRALLELIERWTAQTWWHGTLAATALDDDLTHLFVTARTDWPRITERPTTAVALQPSGLPATIAIWSSIDGRALCFGLACRDDPADAIRAALRELYQMEFGLSVIQHRSANDVPLGPAETAILSRATDLQQAEIADRLTLRDPTKITKADPRNAMARLGISYDLTPDRADNHQVVTATAANWETTPETNTRPRWPLYGAG